MKTLSGKQGITMLLAAAVLAAAYSVFPLPVEVARPLMVLPSLLPMGATQLRFSPDGRVLVEDVSVRGVEVWNVRDWKVQRTLPVNTGLIEFSPESRYLATSGSGITLWDTRRWKVASRLRWDGDIAFCRAGPELAVFDRGQITILDLRTMRAMRTLLVPGGLLSIQYAPDGRSLAVGDGRGDVTLLDSRTGAVLRRIHRFESYVHDIQFSDDGRYLAAIGCIGDAETDVAVWETHTWKEIDHPNAIWAKTIRFCPHTSLLAIGSVPWPVRLWDASTGRVVASFGHYTTGDVESITFTPDGRLFAYEGNDGQGSIVKVWRVPDEVLNRR